MEYLQISETSSLPGIKHLSPFKAVIAIEDPVSSERQQVICDWLVDSGCKYVMICGEESASWESMVRQTNLDRVSLDDMTPEQFVMITNHAKEGLRSVFWHAKKHAKHSHVKMVDLVTVHVSNQNRSTDYLAIFQKA